jgi:uncharacterized repeat protein (TIGR01451 family)
MLLFGSAPSALGAPTVISVAAGPAAQAVTELVVNYSHDWVAGVAGAGEMVNVTVNDGADTYKDSAVVGADGAGDFFVGCDDWMSGNCPDIAPGDKVYATSDGGTAEIAPLGALTVTELDVDTDMLAAELHADWLSSPVEVRCQVWEEYGPDIQTEAAADGGSFTCDFGAEGWDLLPGQMIALRYYEPDGDSVVGIVLWPWMRVNVTDDWVGGDYPVGHTMSVTVMDPYGGVKATAEVPTSYGLGWGQNEGFETQDGSWSPTRPDIRAFDRVLFEADDGYTNTILVGAMHADVDVWDDSITGYVFAPFDETLDVECHPWGAYELGMNDVPGKNSSAEPDGSAPFHCQWNPGTEWDVEPGQRIAAMYLEPDDGDRVIYAFQQAAPHLRIDKRTNGVAGENGNLHFVIEVWNDGQGDAEDVTITDTMVGLSYLSDTSGLTPSGSGAGPIVWTLGTVPRESYQRFDLFVEVTVGETLAVSNTVEIATSNPFDQGDPGEKTATWDGVVAANSTDLNIGKGARTGDPAPGNSVIFDVTVCNEGDTGSTEITLTDTLLENLTLLNWWSDEPGWYEVSSDDVTLVVALPSLDGHACSSISVRAHVADEAEQGDLLVNEAVISADNDLSGDNNEAYWEGYAGMPRLNVWVNKEWSGGQLVAGDEIRYWISYGNDGNVPAHDLELVDTLPEGTVFVSSWRHDQYGGTQVAPRYVGGGRVIWDIPTIDNGIDAGMEVVLRIDDAAPAGHVLTNKVEISQLPGEDWLEDNEAVWTEQVYEEGPNLRVRKTVNWRGDGSLEYHIQFQNVGTETMETVLITDRLPSNTTWDGWWRMDFDQSRLDNWDYDAGSEELSWTLTELYPGEVGWLHLGAVPDEPGAPLIWYSNEVEISAPGDDINPADNISETQSYSGGEVRRIEFWVNLQGPNSMWGEAVPDTTVTVNTPSGEYLAYADPNCNGCWDIGDVGPLAPGDVVEVEAGAGTQPVTVTVPDPFDAAADSMADQVIGQIDHLDAEWVRVIGYWEGGYSIVQTDSDGGIVAPYADVPPGAEGHIRYETMVDYATVVWHRPFGSLDLVLTVNYGQNWVEAPYEAGHLGWFDVTKGDGVTLKATSEVESQAIPAWGGWPGFTTAMGDPWVPARPDIVPGDWVKGLVDNGNHAEVRVGTITGTLDLDTDVVEGTIDVPWSEEDELHGWCAVWEEDGPSVEFTFDPLGGAYLCDLNAAGWDLQAGHHVAVGYHEPDGDTVLTMFFEPTFRMMLPIAMTP